MATSFRILPRLLPLSLTRGCSSAVAQAPAPLRTTFAFRPDTKTSDPHYQAYYWTKTHLVPRPPPQPLRGHVDLQQLEETIKRSVRFARLFESPSEDDLGNTYPNGLVHNILRILLSSSTACPQLSDLHIATNAHVDATWWCGPRLLAVQGRPGTLLSSKRSFPILFDRDTVAASKSCQILPSPEKDVYEFSDLESSREIEEHFSTAYHSQRVYPHCHTLVVTEKCTLSQEPQLVQKCIMHLFGALATQAIDRYGEEISGKELPRPECAHGIVTDGNWFTFIWYQLNTLDLSSVDDGVKNLANVTNLGCLYEQNNKLRIHNKISDMNSEIIETMSAMLLWS